MTEARKTLKDGGAIKITVRMMTGRLRASKMGAAPGASGWRNSHIAMIAEAEGGARWLREWIRLWVPGNFTTNVAGLWEPGLLVPLRRPGGKLRPIALSRRCHDRRCRQEAPQIIPRTTVFGSDCRECEGKDPGGAVMVTDLSNACGSLWRQCALEAVRIHCPQMLGILCTQWESGSTTALAIHQALLETRKKTENGQDDETRRETGELKELAYADDAFLLGAARVVNLFLDFLEERLEHHGWKLVWEMSHAWITSVDLLDETEQVHEATLFERMPRSRCGIKAPGVGCGWRVQHLRLQKMLTAEMAESPHHAVWLLLTKSAAREQTINRDAVTQAGLLGTWKASG